MFGSTLSPSGGGRSVPSSMFFLLGAPFSMAGLWIYNGECVFVLLGLSSELSAFFLVVMVFISARMEGWKNRRIQDDCKGSCIGRTKKKNHRRMGDGTPYLLG